MEYKEITNERATELGKMIVSFSDTVLKPYSFNGTEYIVECFNYTCSLLIINNRGCWYKETRK